MASLSAPLPATRSLIPSRLKSPSVFGMSPRMKSGRSESMCSTKFPSLAALAGNPFGQAP